MSSLEIPLNFFGKVSRQRSRNWLSGVRLEVAKGRTRIDFKAVGMLIGGDLKVDPCKVQFEGLRQFDTLYLKIPRKDGFLYLGGTSLKPVGIAVVCDIRDDGGRKGLCSYDVNPHVDTIDIFLELYRAPLNLMETREIFGFQSLNDRTHTADGFVDHALMAVEKFYNNRWIIRDKSLRHPKTKTPDQLGLVGLGEVGSHRAGTVDYPDGGDLTPTDKGLVKGPTGSSL